MISSVYKLTTSQSSNKVFAAISSDSAAKIFDYEEVKPISLESKKSIIPWGEENDLPDQVLDKIRKCEVMSSNHFFNIQCGCGVGLKCKNKDGSDIADENVLKFLQRNNMPMYWMEQQTDMKHFFLAVAVIILSGDQKNIVRIVHKDVQHCRFQEPNNKGKIENIFYTNWKNDTKGKDAEVIPLLDYMDPLGDLNVRMGLEPDDEGKKQRKTNDKKFAIVTRIPIPGHKVYSFPYYWSVFNSGWYDIKAMIPQAKKAKMENGISPKYHVEISPKYWEGLFADNNAVSEKAKKDIKTSETQNIIDFLSGVENSGKTWISGFYVDMQGKEQSLVKITLLDNKKEGGDYIEDAEESSNVICYAMGVHPSLIGSSPAKNKNINGTEARELFTMKQALEHSSRELLMGPLRVVAAFNNWDVVFEVPDIMLTTLDTGTDAIEKVNEPKTIE